MQNRRFNPTLPLAFALAIALHAAVLPLVLLGGGGGAITPHDLRVVALSAPTTAAAGETVTLHPTVRYEPQSADHTLLRRTDRVLLSRDRAIDEHDTELLSFPLSWNNSSELQQPLIATVTLPPDADGPYQLIYHADALGQLPDTNLSNNTRATPIYITGPLRPELQITAANLPKQATLGGTTFFSYTTTNRGPGYASTPDGLGGWRDAVYLSTDTTLDERDFPLRTFKRRSPLGPGETYAHSRVALDLPRIPPGTYHLILVADADQVLDQPSFTAGYYTEEIELVDTNLPDLAIAAIVSPRSATLGQAFTIQWEAANLGSVSTDISGVVEREDAVYLSRDDTLDSSDTPLTSLRITTPLAAQQRQQQSAVSITIPNEPQFAPGTQGNSGSTNDTSGGRGWHLIVVADDTNTIDEGPFEDNNAFAVPIKLREPRDEEEPDLGEPDNDPKLTVAWIEYQRVQEHMARLTETIQPAIQNIIDPDPNAPLALEPKPPAPPAIALQPGGAPRDPAQPVDPNEQNSARPQPPIPDAPDTNTAPRPLDPNAQPPQRVEGIPGNADDLPMPRDGEDTPSPDAPDNSPLRPDAADRDDSPRNPGDREVESDADPDAPDTDSETDSQTPAERDTETDETNPNGTDSDTASEVMDESVGETPNENEPSEEPTERDGDADNDDEMDETTATPQPAEQDSDQPEGDPVPPSNPSEEQETTRAPRDDAEADPTDDTPDRLRLEEGNVLVGQGVRVSTSRIRRGSTTSRLTAIPRDTRVRVVFDNEGKVVEAELLGQGTGYADWDARLLEALYRWTAAGPDIEAADPEYVLILEYQFGLLNRRD